MSWPAARPLGGRTDHGRGLREVPGALERGDDERLSPVGLLAAVEQVERLDDPARRLVVLERDRLAVEPGRGIVGRVPPIRDGDAAEVLARRAGGVQVALGDMATHCAGVRRPTGAYQAKCAFSAGGDGRPVLDARHRSGDPTAR